MGHFSRLSQTVVDVAEGDHDRELRFWGDPAGLVFCVIPAATSELRDNGACWWD